MANPAAPVQAQDMAGQDAFAQETLDAMYKYAIAKFRGAVHVKPIKAYKDLIKEIKKRLQLVSFQISAMQMKKKSSPPFSTQLVCTSSPMSSSSRGSPEKGSRWNVSTSTSGMKRCRTW